MMPRQFEGFLASDLRIVSGESFTNDEGERCVVVYSFSMDALTCVGPEEERQLLAAGVAVVESVPEPGPS